MKRPIRLLALAAVLVGPLAAPASAVPPTVRVYHHEGVIHGVSAMLLERALKESAAAGDALFVIELDTEGGLVTAAEDMIKEILASEVPVAVYVMPRGAHAASAGFFLLISADVAAMAPVTRTGSAHPVTATGENRSDDIMLKKVSEDLAALMRSTARARGRPVDLADKAVRDAVSWSAEEALEAGMIDVIAPDLDTLLRDLDGREVTRIDGSKITLNLAGAEIREHQFKFTESFKNVILHPALMALLLSIAGIGLYIEFTHPGLILPGAVGAICLLVFLYGTQVLPVNYFAAAMVLLGVVFFILEIKVVSYGMLSLAGAVMIGLGMWLLFPASVPGLRVPLAALLPLIIFMVLLLSMVTYIVGRTMRQKPSTGREGLVGEVGVAATILDLEGSVHVHGEVWQALARETIPAGARVKVVGSTGLLLQVEPAGPENRSAARTD